jgi:soluble lytic murein transglycosylase-like protein
MAGHPWDALPNFRTWAPALDAAEAANQLPRGLLAAVAFEESSFSTDVIEGTRPSAAGALGMMQLEPAYFSSAAVSRPFTAYDVNAQIAQAAQQLKNLHQKFGTWEKALAAYDAGSGRLISVLAGKSQLPVETVNYVERVVENMLNGLIP